MFYSRLYYSRTIKELQISPFRSGENQQYFLWKWTTPFYLYVVWWRRCTRNCTNMKGVSLTRNYASCVKTYFHQPFVTTQSTRNLNTEKISILYWPFCRIKTNRNSLPIFSIDWRAAAWRIYLPHGNSINAQKDPTQTKSPLSFAGSVPSYSPTNGVHS